MDTDDKMKLDMSKSCGDGYQHMQIRRHRGEITEEEFIAWYYENCDKCCYMSEICMLGEEYPE